MRRKTDAAVYFCKNIQMSKRRQLLWFPIEFITSLKLCWVRIKFQRCCLGQHWLPWSALVSTGCRQFDNNPFCWLRPPRCCPGPTPSGKRFRISSICEKLAFYDFFYSLKGSPCCKDLGATCHTGRVAKPFVTRVLQGLPSASYQGLNEMPLPGAGIIHL